MDNLNIFLKKIRIIAKRELKEKYKVYNINSCNQLMYLIIMDLKFKKDKAVYYDMFDFIGKDVINLMLKNANVNIAQLIIDINLGKWPHRDTIILTHDDNKNIKRVIDYCKKYMSLHSFIYDPFMNLFNWVRADKYKQYEKAHNNYKAYMRQLMKVKEEDNILII